MITDYVSYSEPVNADDTALKASKEQWVPPVRTRSAQRLALSSVKLQQEWAQIIIFHGENSIATLLLTVGNVKSSKTVTAKTAKTGTLT